MLHYFYISNRLELLVKGDDSDPNMQMLLKLVDLLASCSEGENLFIESVCQNIMSIDELLKVTICIRWYAHVDHARILSTRIFSLVSLLFVALKIFTF